MKTQELLIGHLSEPSDMYPESYIQGYVQDRMPSEADVDLTRLAGEAESSSYWSREWAVDGVDENPLLYLKVCGEISALSEAFEEAERLNSDNSLTFEGENGYLAFCNSWSLGEVERNITIGVPKSVPRDVVESFGFKAQDNVSSGEEELMSITGGYQVSEVFDSCSFETEHNLIDVSSDTMLENQKTTVRAKNHSNELEEVLRFVERNLGRFEDILGVKKPDLPEVYTRDD